MQPSVFCRFTSTCSLLAAGLSRQQKEILRKQDWLKREDSTHAFPIEPGLHGSLINWEYQIRDHAPGAFYPEENNRLNDANGSASAAKHRAMDGSTGRMDHASPPAKMSFLITAWTPQLPSTTWVMPKSTPIVIREIASSSVSFFVVIRNLRILRNASRKARSTDDFE